MELAALQMALQKNMDAEEGVQGKDTAFPKGGKGALFDIREIFKIFKKIITCSLHKAKITNYESIEKSPTTKICPPPPGTDFWGCFAPPRGIWHRPKLYILPTPFSPKKSLPSFYLKRIVKIYTL
jgi:hypothetical protein